MLCGLSESIKILALVHETLFNGVEEEIPLLPKPGPELDDTIMLYHHYTLRE